MQLLSPGFELGSSLTLFTHPVANYRKKGVLKMTEVSEVKQRNIIVILSSAKGTPLKIYQKYKY